MDSYEYKVKSEEIKELIKVGEYRKAVEIADTIDWTKVRSITTLCTISDLYKINRRYSEAKILLERANNRCPGGRQILFSLCETCIKMNDVLGATEYYKEYSQVASTDIGRDILLYKLYEAQEVNLEERIEVLEKLKKKEYTERWGYELAYLYHRVGLATKCVEECDELVLWFREGKFVKKALELKMLHQELTASQEALYKSQLTPKDREAYISQTTAQEPVDTAAVPVITKPMPPIGGDTIQIKTMDVGEYSTINIQKELAESMKDVLVADNNFEPLVSEPESKTGITEEIMAPMLQNTGSMQELFVDDSIEITGEIYEDSEDEDDLTRVIPTIDQSAMDDTVVYTPKHSSEPATSRNVTRVTPIVHEEPVQPVAPVINSQPSGMDLTKATKDELLELINLKVTEAINNAISGHVIVSKEEVEKEAPKPVSTQTGLIPPIESMATYLTPGYKASAAREEEPASEKQITGQISIEDYLNDWQNSKKKNKERYSENLRQRVLQDTGEIFVEFDQENDKIMDTISAKAEEASKSDPDKEYEDFINSIMAEEDSLPAVEELEEVEEESVVEEVASEVVEEDAASEEEFENELLEIDSPIDQSPTIEIPIWEEEDLLPIMKDGKLVSEDDLLKISGKGKKEKEEKTKSSEEHISANEAEHVEESVLTKQPEQEEIVSIEEAEAIEESVIEVEPEPVEESIPAEDSVPAAVPKTVQATSYDDDEDDFEFAEDLHGGSVEDNKEEPATEEKSEEEYYYNYEEDDDDYEYGVATGAVASSPASTPEPVKEEDSAKKSDGVSEEEMLQVYIEDEEEEDIPRVASAANPVEEETEKESEDELLQVYTGDEEEEDIPRVAPATKLNEENEQEEEKPAKPAKSNKVEEPEEEDEEEIPEKKPARRRPVEDDDEETPDRNMTEDETALFSNFVQTKGAKKKLIKALDKISLASYTGNVFVIGDANEETAELSKAVLKYAQNTDSNFTGKTGKVTGASLNDKPIESMLEKMANGGLIIEKPSRMNAETVKELLSVLDQDNHGILIIMQDTQKAMHKMMDHFDEMKEIFNVQVQIEELSDDTLVAYGRKYAEHLEYAIDDMGMLALHTKIESMQTSDHIVTVADVRAIIDAAIDKSNKKNIRHFSDVLLGKRYDEEDMIILKERDFED